MMREILFRGKRIDNGEWVCGSLISKCSRFFVVDKENKTSLRSCTTHCCDKYDWRSVEVDPATVGQFTGLTDKNGKMIFEGDKVAVLNPKPFARTTGTVVFIDGCFEVKFHREDYGRDYLKCLTCNRECEVIGNIYDNPELLKEDV